MALTAVEAYLNRTEFSRLEKKRKDLKVRIVPTPVATTGETVDVKIVRKDGNVIHTTSVVLNGDKSKGEVVTIDLASILDPDGHPLVIRGDYDLLVEENGNISVSDTKEFRVALVTVDELKSVYCYGLTLYASEVKAVKKQPRVVTGVTVDAISAEMSTGTFLLDYDQANNTLQFGNGAVVELDSSIADEILPDDKGNYIEVTIDHFALPNADASEALIIDQQVMDVAAIQGEIDKASDEIEHDDLKVYLEPKRVATEPFYSTPDDGEYFDEKIDRAAYYRDAFNNQSKGWHVSLPLQQLIHVSKLTGFVGDDLALEVLQGAISTNRVSGDVEVLPFDSQYAYLWTFHLHFKLFGYREVIPRFWAFKGKAGLEKTDGDIVKAIGYKASIPILTTAGHAYRAGYASQSISKDGVSVSNSYTSSATYGIYSATIAEYQKWMKEEMPKMCRKYRGLTMTTL